MSLRSWKSSQKIGVLLISSLFILSLIMTYHRQEVKSATSLVHDLQASVDLMHQFHKELEISVFSKINLPPDEAQAQLEAQRKKTDKSFALIFEQTNLPHKILTEAREELQQYRRGVDRGLPIEDNKPVTISKVLDLSRENLLSIAENKEQETILQALKFLSISQELTVDLDLVIAKIQAKGYATYQDGGYILTKNHNVERFSAAFVQYAPDALRQQGEVVLKSAENQKRLQAANEIIARWRALINLTDRSSKNMNTSLIDLKGWSGNDLAWNTWIDQLDSLHQVGLRNLLEDLPQKTTADKHLFRSLILWALCIILASIFLFRRKPFTLPDSKRPLVLPVIILASGLCIVVISLVMHQHANRTKDTWKQLEQQRAEKAILLADLVLYTGHGGLIHGFKNSILRPSYIELESLSHVVGALVYGIYRYTSANLSATEVKALSDVLKVVLQAALVNQIIPHYDTVKERDENLIFDEKLGTQGIDTLIRILEDETGNPTKGTTLIRLTQAFGFGGIMSAVKNCIIRQTAEICNALPDAIQRADHYITVYRSLNPTKVEQQNLDELHEIVRYYRGIVPTILNLIKEGYGPEELDRKLNLKTEADYNQFLVWQLRGLKRELSHANKRFVMQVNKSFTDQQQQTMINVFVALFLTLLATSLTYWYQRKEQYLQAELRNEILEKQQANNEIQKLNANLEIRVKERTKELEEAQSSLIQAEKMAALGGLVAGVAHEINTPLGIGVTASSLIADALTELKTVYKSGKITAEDLEHYINTSEEAENILSKNLSRAAELVHSFKQVAVDQNTEEIRTINIRAYIDDVILSLKPQLKRSQLDIRISCDKLLTVEIMSGAFGQILTNLITNSLLHAYEPGEKGTLSIDISIVDKDKLLMIYKDDGKGIPKELVSKVFDPFVTTKRGQGGTGLGLHILHEIVRQKLGGTVTCTSTLGQGVQFDIIFKAPIKASNALSARSYPPSSE